MSQSALDLRFDMARPRKHPIGTTASERVAISTANLKSAGGARKTFRLSPEAHHALRLSHLTWKPRTPSGTGLRIGCLPLRFNLDYADC
jgi:hypothetical protein